MVGLLLAVVILHNNLARGHAGDDAVALGQRDRARVDRRLVLHAGRNKRRFGL